MSKSRHLLISPQKFGMNSRNNVVFILIENPNHQSMFNQFYI